MANTNIKEEVCFEFCKKTIEKPLPAWFLVKCVMLPAWSIALTNFLPACLPALAWLHRSHQQACESHEVFKILSDLTAKSYWDLWNIPKIAGEALKNNLIILFNHLIKRSIFPDKLRTGTKKKKKKKRRLDLYRDSKSVCSNCRPISIFPLDFLIV